MISKRAKVTTTATILGLGALAGIATESNHGLQMTARTVNGHEIATRTSGATTSAATTTAPGGRAPIVTRVSGAPGTVPSGTVDD